ncbi:extracellular solute-binding protein [Gordonia sp. ABSL1-1]|uniref:extracellular solute-binding protein n=1 Tax=Gordonia sp. ABSL1-1 TaxID=3053923 RepID=UPI0025723637|nr:extracellular solute-binding protein [Gordonia sp. ABSL1-1]MDL9937068.1 extracellular solute-binding protein [Gordonia sp. ABSL1-1]
MNRRRGRTRSVGFGRKAAIAVAALATTFPILTACGTDYEAGVLNFYSPADGADTFAEISAKCSAESGGQYRIENTVLPKSADDQRLQLARRLAGDDKTLDLMAMDVVWTAEFADAGWAVAVPDGIATGVESRTLAGPLDTAIWRKKGDERERLYAIPMSTNTQLLWYRTDVLAQIGSRPARTWEAMIVDAQQSLARGGPSQIMVTARQYEGLMVWFNSVLATVGGEIVDPQNPDRQALNDTPAHRAATVEALRVLKAVATAPGHDPSLTNSDEGTARTGMEKGKALYQVNWPFVFAGMQENAAKGSVDFLTELQKYSGLYADGADKPKPEQLRPLNIEMRKKFNFTNYPGVGNRPGKATLGGFNIAVAGTSQQQELAFKAAECITSKESQKYFALNAGPPPVIGSLYSDDAEFRAIYPMADEVLKQLKEGRAAVRPKTPVYQAISTLVVAKLSPVGQWDPETLVDELADAVQKAIDGEGLVP